MSGVNTRDDRAACVGTFLPVPSVFPNPDGGIDTGAERQHAAYSYSAIAATAAAAVAVIALSRNAFRFVFSRVFSRVN